MYTAQYDDRQFATRVDRGWDEAEAEAKITFALCPAADVRLTVADLPNNQLSDRRQRVEKLDSGSDYSVN
jgi:hypothetical protein